MTSQKHTASKIENSPKSLFFIFHLNETGYLTATHCANALYATVQPNCISIQNVAIRETAGPMRSPTARLGCRFVRTTPGFAQKTDAKPVGGRGISVFQPRFFFATDFSDGADVGGKSAVGRCTWTACHLPTGEKNRLSRGGFSASSGSGGLLSSQGASTMYEFTSGSCCLQTQTD